MSVKCNCNNSIMRNHDLIIFFYYWFEFGMAHYSIVTPQPLRKVEELANVIPIPIIPYIDVVLSLLTVLF